MKLITDESGEIVGVSFSDGRVSNIKVVGVSLPQNGKVTIRYRTVGDGGRPTEGRHTYEEVVDEKKEDNKTTI